MLQELRGRVHSSKWIGAGCVAALMGVHTFAQGFFPGARVRIAGGIAIAIGDVDGDGKVDLLAASQSTDYLLSRGDGLGGFAAPISQPLPNSNIATRRVFLRDVNSDDRLDLVAIGDSSPGPGETIAVRLRSASGALGADVATQLPQASSSFPSDILGRFNNDAYLDYAFIGSSGQSILLARGTATGAFNAPTTIYNNPTSHVTGIVAGDIDGDGDLDLLAIDPQETAPWRFTNNGNGTFAPKAGISNVAGANEIALIDIDEDTRPDIVFGAQNPWGVWWAKGLGAGAFAPPTQLVATAYYANGFVPVDLDRDGHVELVWQMIDDSAALNHGLVGIARGLGLGAYAAPTLHPSAEFGLAQSADIDGDGRLDLVSCGSDGATVLLGDGIGSVRSAERYSNYAASTPRIADFDLDGTLDVVTMDSTSVVIQYGTPGGILSAPVSFPVGYGYQAAVGDLDLDGRPDVVIISGVNTVSVLLGVAGGGLGPAAPFFAGARLMQPTIGDVTGDGLPDVVVAEAPDNNYPFFSPGDEVKVLAGDGLGGLLAPVIYAVGTGVSYTTIADFDRDGRNDLITGTWVGLKLQLGQASGALSAPTTVSPHVFDIPPSVVDIDGDGNLDYIGSGGHTTTDWSLYVLLGDGHGHFPSQQVLHPPIPYSNVVAADFDGDGRGDIVCNSHGGFELLLQDPSGGFEPPREYGNTGYYDLPNYLAAGDVDGDGRIDMLASTSRLTVSRNVGAPSRVGVYCTAKVNSNGCTPQLSFSGAPSATQTSGFVVSASALVNQKSGMFFYGLNGSIAAPFYGGLRCVANPLRRTLVSLSGGSPLPASDCTGVISIDMNAFARGALGGSPDLALSITGTHVHCQAWARDAGAPPNNVQLSSGLQYFVEP